jgi:glycosyltransferase involved in cell wall biosynthesis
LFVGTWYFRKGITTLVDAFTALHAQRPDVTLTVAGSNVPGQAVLHHFPASVQRNVTVCPPLAPSELANLYNTHDIFVLPSLYEGFGMVFLEAMAAAMVVVGTETGGMPDLIEHGTDGFLIPRRDPAALRHTLMTLLNDDALRVAVGERARAKAVQYTWERAARHTAEVYQELVKCPRRRTVPLPAGVVVP